MASGAGTCRVEAVRGELVESVHEVSVAVVQGEGRLVAFAGEPNARAFARSAIKPLQALPLVEDGVTGRFGITEEELALCCASHSGETRHVELARALLRRVDATEEALACGPHWPFHESAANALRAAGEAPGRIHNNCSGKHAGMLALARFHGWPLAGYQAPEHPVQQRMRHELARWTGLAPEELGLAVDGCGVATFAAPLNALARGFAHFAREANRAGSGAAQVVGAMVRHPWLVAGTDRLCTALMEAAGGRLFAKVGAEGVYCVGVPDAGLGIALKVHDGAARAAEPALLEVLGALELLSARQLAELARWRSPVLTNTRAEPVGCVRAVVRLEAWS